MKRASRLSGEHIFSLKGVLLDRTSVRKHERGVLWLFLIVPSNESLLLDLKPSMPAGHVFPGCFSTEVVR